MKAKVPVSKLTLECRVAEISSRATLVVESLHAGSHTVEPVVLLLSLRPRRVGVTGTEPGTKLIGS